MHHERKEVPIEGRQIDSFWREAFTLAESVTARVLPHVITFGLFATVVTVAAHFAERWYQVRLGLEIGFHDIGGALLTLALVLRTNAGYDRWWEARKLWGGIVNQCRNLAMSAVSYGPDDAAWRHKILGWTAVFPYAARSSLQREPLATEVSAILGQQDADRLANAQHMPSFVALRIGQLLAAGCEWR